MKLTRIATLAAATLFIALAGSAPAEAHGWRHVRYVRTYVPVRVAVAPRIVVSRPIVYGRVAVIPRVVVTAPVVHGRVAVGAIDFDVEPEETAVFVDGVYRGTADDLDGFPAKLYLPAGAHLITLRTPGGRVWSRTMTVLPGREIDIDTHFSR